MKNMVLAGVAALALSVPAMPSLAAAEAGQLAAAAAAKFPPWGVDLAAADSSVRPGDDFWAYVNGGWDKRTQIDPQRTFAGIDSVLNDQIDADVRSIIEDTARDPAANGPIGQQIGDFYGSWMDEAAIESRGTTALTPYLDRIDAAKTRADLIDLFATIGFSSPVGIAIAADLKDPTRYTVDIDQSGLGLPTRDYYLLPDAKFKAYRTAYRAYIAQMLSMAGYRNSEARADRILALETAMARVHWPIERLRDVDQTYHPMTRAQLRSFAPQFQWDRMLGKLGLQTAPQVIVGEPSAITAAGKLFAATPLRYGKTISPSISSATMRRSCPRRSTTRRSISIRRRCAGFPSSATGGGGGLTSSTERSVKGSAKSTFSGAIRPRAIGRRAS